MITLYVIESLSYKFRYVGITNDFERRFAQHNNGRNKSTKGHRPFKVKLKENFNNYKEARVKEVFLKSGKGRELLNRI